MYNLKMIKNIIFILAILLFSGCEIDLFNDKKVEQLQRENSELQAKQQAKAITLEHQNARVALEKEQELKRLQLEAELEKQRLDNSKETSLVEIKTKAEVERLRLEKELEKTKLIQESARIEAQKRLELEKYLFALLGLLMIIVSFFIFYYFKKRREDKLIAYNDNLKKYFLFKEQERRTRIAEKVLETIAEGKLSKEDEARLVRAMDMTNVDQLTTEQTLEVEMIEDHYSSSKPKD